MQIRCSHCHRPYALTKEIILEILDELEREHLGHYNATCPHCRRVNRISHGELLRAVPNRAQQVKEDQAGE